MKITDFSRMHVGLYVSNLQKTIDFYTQFFEVEPVKVKPDYAKFVLTGPDLVISFIEKEVNAAADFGHLGFQLENLEAVQKKLEKMKQEQIPVLDEGCTTCCHAIQEKFWVTDPDGFRWEVYYFHEDVNDAAAEKCESEEVCCA